MIEVLGLGVSGVAFLYFGLIAIKETVRLRKQGIPVIANIIAYEAREGDTMTIYHPKFQFQNEQGEMVEIVHDSGTSKQQRNLPLPKEILYINTDGEYEILINKSLWTKVFPYAITIVGVLLFCSFIFRINEIIDLFLN